MRKFKLSFALVVAILAVGVTAATKANVLFGKKLISGCFTSVVLTQNGSNELIPTAALDCQDAKDQILPVGQYQFVKSAATTVDPNCPLVSNVFCCVELETTTDTRAAEIDLGEGPQRYKVSAVHCKIQ